MLAYRSGSDWTSWMSCWTNRFPKSMPGNSLRTKVVTIEPRRATAAAAPRRQPWRTSHTTMGSRASATKNAMRMLTPSALSWPRAYHAKIPTKTATTPIASARGTQRGGRRESCWTGRVPASGTSDHGSSAGVVVVMPRT